MKKGLIYIALAAVTLQACRKEESNSENETTIAEQNQLDDKAIIDFMKNHYFDSRGNVKKFNNNDTSDDNEQSLSTYNPTTLPSGVVYIIRPENQPEPGKTIGNTDILDLMGTAYSYIAKKDDKNGSVSFTNQSPFVNTISNGGNVYSDPFFYYAKETSLQTNEVTRDYYEIEGFQEGIRKFKSCEINVEENYNLQGVILVPSRAAYARDKNGLSTSTNKFYDRSFMFNFQIYKTTER